LVICPSISDDENACEQAESELFEVVDGIPESKHMEFFFSKYRLLKKIQLFSLKIHKKKLVERKKKDFFCFCNARSYSLAL
jgi:hypothetical protein